MYVMQVVTVRPVSSISRAPPLQHLSIPTYLPTLFFAHLFCHVTTTIKSSTSNSSPTMASVTYKLPPLPYAYDVSEDDIPCRLPCRLLPGE